MKKINIFYWICTILVAAMMAFSGITAVTHNPEGTKLIVQHLGYPEYFNTYLGALKIIGAVLLVVPGFPRLKEWIYAGFTFDLVSAVYSFISVGDPVSSWALILLFLALLAGSYIFYHKKLKAGAAAHLK
ncbi:MAG: DoxX family protein [Parafilimonas sp.]